MNHAITDAGSLSEQVSALASLTPETLSGAIRAYEAELVPRGRQAVEMNNLNSATVTNWSAVSDSPLLKHGSRSDATISQGDRSQK